MPQFEHHYADQLGGFYTSLKPTPLKGAKLLYHSEPLAQELGLDASLFDGAHREYWCGEAFFPGMKPLAQVYSGHQFGVWAGQLGDGRGILLGEQVLPNGQRYDWHLKGAGLTPYSRMGDGRAVLRSIVREFLASEALHHLSIPTTRALTIVTSDQPVFREQPERGAMLMRIAESHIRFGHFEHFYYRKQPEQVKQLADYVIAHHWPQLLESEPLEAQRYQRWFTEVVERTAKTIAQWQSVGFAHGVMNTDNMSILGLTLDYGPFGFMEAYDPRHICNHTDQQGRYAYSMQPQIGHWNCYALGQALLPLINDVEAAQQALDVYQSAFAAKIDELMLAKLGLTRSAQTDEQEADRQLFDAMFTLMHANHADFTLFFRRLGGLRLDDASGDEPLRDLFIDRPAFDAWAAQYRARLRRETRTDAERKLAMDQVNPKYILRNYLAQVAIEKAQNKDYSELARLLTVLQRPYDEQPEHEHYAALPPDWASHLEVSCSS